jgi:hypothetical protein
MKATVRGGPDEPHQVIFSIIVKLPGFNSMNHKNQERYEAQVMPAISESVSWLGRR